MTMVDLDMLRSWERAWEIPELWTALCREDREFSADALARACVHRMAHPLTAVEVFEELIASGEIDAAVALLDLPAFQRMSGDPLLLLDRLATAEAKRLSAFDQRAAVLRLRAARINRPLAPLLRDLEAARAAYTHRGHIGDAMLRAIEDGLSRSEADVPPVVTAMSSIPRAPRWPFDQGSADCCEWFLAAAGLESGLCPVGFLERWAAHDEASLVLTIEMLALLRGRFVVDAVASFAEALERFLGCVASDWPREVTECDGGFLTTLHGLPSFGLLPLVASALAGGIPLFVPTNPRSRLPADIPLGIVFAAETGTPSHGALMLEPRHLFPLMRHGQQRALQLVRGLAPQIPPDQLRPPLPPTPELVFGRDRELQRLCESTGTIVVVGATGIGKTSLLLRHRQDVPDEARRIDDTLAEHLHPEYHLLELVEGRGAIVACTPELWARLAPTFDHDVTLMLLGPVPNDEMRAYLQDQFDLLEVYVDPPALLDRLVWCSGGHPALLDTLLREVWSQQTRRSSRNRAAVTEREVERAWSGEVFRDTAVRMLLAPLSGQPVRAKALVQLLELCDHTQDAQRTIEQAIFVELFDLDVASSAVLDALDVLEYAGLVARETDTNDCIHVAPSQLAIMVSYLIAGPEHIADAVGVV